MRHVYLCTNTTAWVEYFRNVRSILTASQNFMVWEKWFIHNGLWTSPGMQILPPLKLFRAVRDILGILNIGCQTLAMDNSPSWNNHILVWSSIPMYMMIDTMAHQWVFWIQPHTFIESSCCLQAVDGCASGLHGLGTVYRKRGMNFRL